MTAATTMLVHADWSVSPGKRWAARARLGGDGWLIGAVEPVGDCSAFVQSLVTASKQEVVLAGFDFPIGVPDAYGARSGLSSFPDLLQAIGQGRWARFGHFAREPSEIGLERPFYPAGASAGLKQADLLAAHGVAALDQLRRQCERQTSARRAACPLFWTLGGNQVGRAALAGWTEVIKPAQAAGARLWPFDGTLTALSEEPGLVLAETYPAEAYGHVGVAFSPAESKTRKDDRMSKADAIFDWAARSKVHLSGSVTALISDGFGVDKAGEDRFDALLGLCGMIEVVTGRRGEGSHPQRSVWEGWILGQLSQNDDQPSIEPTAVGCGAADLVLTAYGLKRFAQFSIKDDRFTIAIENADIAKNEKSIYAFVVDDDIVRIGSSKARLGNRMKVWQRDVSLALQGLRSSTPPSEAEAWRELLPDGRVGTVYARRGTTVTTPVGTFCAYLDEESLLIGRHQPRLNRSKHR